MYAIRSYYESDIKTLTSYYQKQGYLYVFFGKAEITISKKDKIKLQIADLESMVTAVITSYSIHYTKLYDDNMVIINHT